jgi:hypothetical protein
MKCLILFWFVSLPTFAADDSTTYIIELINRQFWTTISKENNVPVHFGCLEKDRKAATTHITHFDSKTGTNKILAETKSDSCLILSGKTKTANNKSEPFVFDLTVDDKTQEAEINFRQEPARAHSLIRLGEQIGK